MFESDDWIFEDAFDGDDVEEETRWKFSSPCQNGEKTSSVKRRKVDSCEVLPSFSTDSTFVRHAELDIVANVEANDPPFKNQENDDVSRGDLLLGIFQSSTSRKTFDFAKEVENDPSGVPRKTQCFQPKVDATSKVFRYEESREKSHEPMTEERLAKEVKLIRIFPGPAGLIPDMKNDNNISAASYLSSVEALERNKTTTKHIENKSQDEKNLFGEKAWKLLLNDLPKNFLQDYKISTVKDKATSSHCESTKVKFIAGVLDYIDHSHDDPFVVLKDSTGSIEGTIHRDIPLTYPGILEPNVVILLRDVGLLKTTTYVVTNKYHILVSLVNLIAIYSDKGRIVSTSLMESILSTDQTTSNVELNKINDRMTVSKSAYIAGLQKMAESRNASRQASSFSFIPSSATRIEAREPELANCPPMLRPKNDKNLQVTDETLGRFNYSMGTDDLDSTDIFLTTDCDFTTLEEQSCLDRSLCKSTTISRGSEIQQCDLEVRTMEKGSTIDFQKQVKERHLPQKCVTDVKSCGTRNARYERDNCFPSYDNMSCRDSNVSVRSTLPNLKRNVENSKALLSYFTNDIEYDSDDEILSQLDVDNVFDEPKKHC
ncbi:uncharacterized protein [Temnothorax longispinosus]|uniref:Homologous recombination OB-fold protein OB-fold domain-containing protein n=1 Tax=Temnothorax longispinosus TaxID=300112 RepID=A0A4S2KKM6_9HYME|nr:Uncharacterized protein DBV15_08679 [Temnothorax longispinosus]